MLAGCLLTGHMMWLVCSYLQHSQKQSANSSKRGNGRSQPSMQAKSRVLWARQFCTQETPRLIVALPVASISLPGCAASCRSLYAEAHQSNLELFLALPHSISNKKTSTAMHNPACSAYKLMLWQYCRKAHNKWLCVSAGRGQYCLYQTVRPWSLKSPDG